jgi:hypothetical protein
VAVVSKRADAFLQVMYRIESFTLDRALSGLTDDEFFWEPSTSTWSIRRRSDCRTSTPFGDGDWVVYFENPEPTPAPLTSIAWLFWHIGSMPARFAEIDFVGGSHTMASGWTSPYLTHHAIYTTDEEFETMAPRYTYADVPMKDGLCVLGPPGPEHPVTFFVAAR